VLFVGATVTFENNRKIGWQTIRAPKNGGKKKWMEFRTRQITGYLKNFGKAQLICSQFKTKSNKGTRKHLACNDLKATPRQGASTLKNVNLFFREPLVDRIILIESGESVVTQASAFLF